MYNNRYTLYAFLSVLLLLVNINPFSLVYDLEYVFAQLNIFDTFFFMFHRQEVPWPQFTQRVLWEGELRTLYSQCKNYPLHVVLYYRFSFRIWFVSLFNILIFMSQVKVPLLLVNSADDPLVHDSLLAIPRTLAGKWQQVSWQQQQHWTAWPSP